MQLRTSGLARRRVLLAWAGSVWPFALYMIGLCPIALFTVYAATKTYKNEGESGERSDEKKRVSEAQPR